MSSLLCFTVNAADGPTNYQKAQVTEVWQPEPAIVDTHSSAIPSDAEVLFTGDDLAQWQSVKGGPANWTVDNGTVTVKPGSGDIKTKNKYCDVQLHLEWKTPTPDLKKKGQGRNNSGVFFQQRYEIQILDSYQNRTYSNGQAGSVYKQHIPLVNATRPPETWQTYDIIFNAPRFDGDKLIKPAYVTVLHNGVLVQNHVQLQGPTSYIGLPQYKAHGCDSIKLQDHGNFVSYRNIWVRPL
ncbi:3-keto-disaccharide hydrolase [Gayadomonas joobiniege]|uniref:3-keto-disaccharide hydrolase n=1 Tax=Gayadomonas joobiniege TaxID=1234606 RepID=UPI001ED99ADC|nr:DUF1080 domain-containing protein [Gayadomonas joobiniege]